jgi:hypothetical protein
MRDLLGQSPRVRARRVEELRRESREQRLASRSAFKPRIVK